SLMPQKKNPDCLELIRGHAGRLYGNLISVLVLMKGLPLTYNRDMQLDKEPLFDSFSIIQDELRILAKLIPTIKINKENIEKQLSDESLYATDLAHRLVEKGLPFKEAHKIVGNLIRHSLKYKPIKEMSQKELDRFSTKLKTEEIKKIFQPQESVRTKRSYRRRYARI
ncbi:MAG: argininosuccinate lyase, partial [Candidatus Omnitrophica bacterium]|nr:argininosuccinate lyase [Candidatus Omnitrophota bacterium]